MQRQLFIYLFLLAFVFAKAQQDPLYTMYSFDKLLINPGFAGSSNWVVGTLKYREQARSFTDHPVTQTFNFHAPLQRKRIGLGAKVINDQIGIQNTLNASLFFSYHLTLAGGKLSAGLEGGLFRRTVNFSKLILTWPGDVAIPTHALSMSAPDLAAGLYYQKKQFYMGFSAMHLLQPGATADPLPFPPRHLFLLVGNVFDIKRDWTLEPSGLFKYLSPASWQYDVNIILYYDNKFGLGVQYRNNSAVSGMLRLEVLRGLRIAYAYDYSLTSKSSFAHNSHEIILSYGIKLAPPPARKEIHPRYYF